LTHQGREAMQVLGDSSKIVIGIPIENEIRIEFSAPSKLLLCYTKLSKLG
jgi:hypothetical protein